MKNFITLINLCILFLITAILTPSRDSSKRHQYNKGDESEVSTEVWTASVPDNESHTASGKLPAKDISLNKRDETFLTSLAENISNNIGIATIAEQRGTTREIKTFGSTLVKDQSEILSDLKKLAALKSLDFPVASPSYTEAVGDIKEMHGKSFDRKFIKMMLFDQKKYARDFERATQSHDADIQVFATKHLPVIQSHLVQLKSMNKSFGF